MLLNRGRGTVIAEGLKIVGNVTAEGPVEIHGDIEGEVRGTSLVVSRQAQIKGPLIANDVTVDGSVNGEIHGTNVVLKSQARVVGDIHHQSLTVERGARFDGRSIHEAVQAPPSPSLDGAAPPRPQSRL